LTNEGNDVAFKVSGSVHETGPLPPIEFAAQSVGISNGFEPLMRDAIQAEKLEQLLLLASVEKPGLVHYLLHRATQAPNSELS
jgi:hypothetical protein